jgi:flavin reductase (DIM6/NTAB) family NADH-FMN oxidoreductase RutF
VDCRVVNSHTGGDHTIFIGEVLAAGASDQRLPLLYYQRRWGRFEDLP